MVLPPSPRLDPPLIERGLIQGGEEGGGEVSCIKRKEGEEVEQGGIATLRKPNWKSLFFTQSTQMQGQFVLNAEMFAAM